MITCAREVHVSCQRATSWRENENKILLLYSVPPLQVHVRTFFSIQGNLLRREIRHDITKPTK